MHVFKSFTGNPEKSKSINPATLGAPVLGRMDFLFTDMGQGDCTIISCPDNTVYIVDCGSAANLDDDNFQKAKDTLASWAINKKVKYNIHIILTHSDKDHYNKILELIMSKKGLVIGTLYFSNSGGDTKPLYNYKVNALSSNLNHLGNPLLAEVTLNGTTKEVKKWVKMMDNYKSAIPTTITTDTLVLKEGTTTDGVTWKVEIIAGNVLSDTNNSATVVNCKSLVTLITMGAEKTLLTGDATEETMTYLYGNHKALITNVDIFLIPHHGSESSIPTANFLKTVKPQALMVSVDFACTSFNLPRKLILEKWLSQLPDKDDDNSFNYWDGTPNPKYKTAKDLNAIITGPWKGLNMMTNSSRTFVCLQDNADPKNTLPFFGFMNTGFFIFNAKTKKNLYMTGTMGCSEFEILGT